MVLPRPGPTATATRPEVAIFRSVSSPARPAIAPGLTSMTSGAASIRASSGMILLRQARRAGVSGTRETGHTLAAAGDLPGPRQVGVVIHLDPFHGADRRGQDRAATLGELGEPVLVVPVRVAPPGGLQAVGEGDRSGRLDQRDAHVLAVRVSRVHHLGDLHEHPLGVQDDLHLLFGERLDVVDGDDQAAEQRLAPASVAGASNGAEYGAPACAGWLGAGRE